MLDRMWMLFSPRQPLRTTDRKQKWLLQNWMKIQKILWMEESLDFMLQVILPMQMVQLLWRKVRWSRKWQQEQTVQQSLQQICHLDFLMMWRKCRLRKVMWEIQKMFIRLLSHIQMIKRQNRHLSIHSKMSVWQLRFLCRSRIKKPKRQFHRAMPLWKKQCTDFMPVRTLCIRTVRLVWSIKQENRLPLLRQIRMDRLLWMDYILAITM